MVHYVRSLTALLLQSSKASGGEKGVKRPEERTLAHRHSAKFTRDVRVDDGAPSRVRDKSLAYT
jgi:hypothetical protein